MSLVLADVLGARAIFGHTLFFEHTLFFTAEVEAQRGIRQMRVIVLRPWTYDRALVVVVILITDVPIKPLVQLDGDSGFGRLKTHRIRRDQRSRISGRISYPIALTIVLVNSISGEKRDAWSNSAYRLNIEEVISDEVETVAEHVLNAIEEIIEFRVAVDPVIVVASADRES